MSRRYTVELVVDDVDGPRSVGAIANYRCRWNAERRARRETAADARIGQDLGTWAVVTDDEDTS